jgi:hypothetical protein
MFLVPRAIRIQVDAKIKVVLWLSFFHTAVYHPVSSNEACALWAPAGLIDSTLAKYLTLTLDAYIPAVPYRTVPCPALPCRGKEIEPKREAQCTRLPACIRACVISGGYARHGVVSSSAVTSVAGLGSSSIKVC